MKYSPNKLKKILKACEKHADTWDLDILDYFVANHNWLSCDPYGTDYEVGDVVVTYRGYDLGSVSYSRVAGNVL